MNRSIVFSNLVHAQRGIISAHEIGIGVAPAAHFDNLRMRGLTDVTFFPVHGFQATHRAIAAVTGDAAKTFRRMDIRFVKLGRLGQILHSHRQMTDGAGLRLRLAIGPLRGYPSK